MHLGIDFLHAAEVPPPHTAHASNPGPFARMVQRILNLAGARHANAVELINELHRRRRKMDRRGRRGESSGGGGGLSGSNP